VAAAPFEVSLVLFMVFSPSSQRTDPSDRYSPRDLELESVSAKVIMHSVIVLLCHKFRCLLRAAQHGQRESVVARAATNLRRIVAIEFGTWRSGRNGGSSGLVTFA
jgi:hypothetical protein